MPPRSSSREKSKENTNVGGALRSSGDESSLIEKQQQYIELLENELKSLKQHFDRTMEKIFSNPLFGSGRMMTNGLSSLLSSSAATTTTQPVGTANEKKKRTREKSHEEESEESESESSEEEKQQQETSSRKSRLRHDKKSSLMDLESDEETIVDNVFQMDFWNQQVSRIAKIKKSKLPHVSTPQEGTKFTIGGMDVKKTKKAAVKKQSELENEPEEIIEALPLQYFQAPVTVTESLAKLIGDDSKQRSFKKDEVYKLVWQYIHKNNRFDEQHHVLLNDDLKTALRIDDSNKKTLLSIDDLNYLVMRQIINETIAKNSIAAFKIKN